MILTALGSNEGFGNDVKILINGVEHRWVVRLDTETGEFSYYANDKGNLSLDYNHQPYILEHKLENYEFLEIHLRKQFRKHD